MFADFHGYQEDLETGRAFTTRSITRIRSRQDAGQGSECQREVRSIGGIERSQRRVDPPLGDVTRETSDFIVDCLENWWEDRKDQPTHIRELVINLDHEPDLESGRTPFSVPIQWFFKMPEIRPTGLYLLLIWWIVVLSSWLIRGRTSE